MENSQRDLEFLYEIGSLRNIPRGWRQTLGVDCASDLEHTMRVVFLALILARRQAEKIDESKLVLMALIHDLPETRTSDLDFVKKDYVQTNEKAAVKDSLIQTSLQNLEEVFEEFCKRETLEAKLVKDADNLDIDLELKELTDHGSLVPNKWADFRQQFRDNKLYTEVAKNFFDEIKVSDPAAWQLTIISKYVNRVAK
ncbi:MAG: HD domain-containing protein [Candidatus Uhrbacteria bacterium]